MAPRVCSRVSLLYPWATRGACPQQAGFVRISSSTPRCEKCPGKVYAFNPLPSGVTGLLLDVKVSTANNLPQTSSPKFWFCMPLSNCCVCRVGLSFSRNRFGPRMRAWAQNDQKNLRRVGLDLTSPPEALPPFCRAFFPPAVSSTGSETLPAWTHPRVVSEVLTASPRAVRRYSTPFSTWTLVRTSSSCQTDWGSTWRWTPSRSQHGFSSERAPRCTAEPHQHQLGSGLLGKFAFYCGACSACPSTASVSSAEPC